jgi:hypothetical protein
MTSVQANQPPSDSGASRRPPGSPLQRPLGDETFVPGESGLHKPRVKMVATSGDLAPAGATYTPPTAAPLPARGAGLHLLLSALAATIAVVFLVLLAHKV